MHRQQNGLEPAHLRRRHFLSNGDQVARQQLGLRQDFDLRFARVIERGIVVVAERSRREFIREDQVDQFFLRVGKYEADFRRGNIRSDSILL